MQTFDETLWDEALRHDEEDAPSRIWARNTFLRMSNVLGGLRAQRLLSDYVDYLGKAQADIDASPADSAVLRRTLHDLRSTSGMLGFAALSDLSATILSDDDMPSPSTLALLRGLVGESLQAAREYLASVQVEAAA